MSLHFSILIDIPPEAFPVGSTLLLDLKAKCLKNEKISPPGKKNYITSINSKSNSTNIGNRVQQNSFETSNITLFLRAFVVIIGISTRIRVFILLLTL